MKISVDTKGAHAVVQDDPQQREAASKLLKGLS